MTQQVINIGDVPGDGSGDPLRVAFNKINENFTELYAAITTLSANIVIINNELSVIIPHEFGTDYGDLGPLIADYGLIIDPVTSILDYGSII